MKASLLYRVASGLLLLFAVGHTMGFRKEDPRWGVDSLISSLRSIRFEVQGMSRAYWDFYVGFGLFVTVLLLFATLLTWQLGGLYFFLAPVIFSAVITLCLGLPSWAASPS